MSFVLEHSSHSAIQSEIQNTLSLGTHTYMQCNNQMSQKASESSKEVAVMLGARKNECAVCPNDTCQMEVKIRSNFRETC